MTLALTFLACLVLAFVALSLAFLYVLVLHWSCLSEYVKMWRRETLETISYDWQEEKPSHRVATYDVLCPARGVNFLEIMGAHGERGARAYNEGLEAPPLAESRGRAPGQGVTGEAPWSRKQFNFAEVQTRRKFVHFLSYDPVHCSIVIFKRIGLLLRFCRLNTDDRITYCLKPLSC